MKAWDEVWTEEEIISKKLKEKKASILELGARVVAQCKKQNGIEWESCIGWLNVKSGFWTKRKKKSIEEKRKSWDKESWGRDGYKHWNLNKIIFFFFM